MPIYWYRFSNQCILSTKLKHETISIHFFHENEHPQQRTKWKILVFEDVAINHCGTNSKRECTMISIGDPMDQCISAKDTQKWMKSKCGSESVHLNRFKLQHDNISVFCCVFMMHLFSLSLCCLFERS